MVAEVDLKESSNLYSPKHSNYIVVHTVLELYNTLTTLVIYEASFCLG